jgi:TolA-binding protein
MLKVYPNSPHRAAALYVTALDERAMGNDAAAEASAREISSKYPNAPYVWDARVMIGETLAAQGKFDAALTHFKSIANDAPAAVKPSLDFGQAMTLARAGKYEDARLALETIVQRYPNSPLVGQAKLQSAITFVRTNKIDQARKALTEVSEKYAALAPSASYYLARCDIQEGKIAAAKGTLMQLAAANPPPTEIVEVRFDLAYCFFALDEFEKAHQLLETFRRNYPFSPHIPEALYYEAMIAYRLGDPADAVQFCDAAIAKGATSVLRPAMLFKGEILLSTQPDQADGLFAELEKDAKDNAEKIRLTLRRGQAAYRKADYKTAQDRLTPIAAMTQDPLQQDAVFLLADTHLQQSHHAEAAKFFRLYIAGGKSRLDEANFKLAIAQRGSNERKPALATLEKLTQGDIKNEWVQRGFFELGQLSYEDHDTEKAAACMEKLLAANPAEPIAAPAMLVAARIELDTGRPEAAARRLAGLIEKYPKNSLAEDAAFTRGLALKEANKTKEAVDAFNAYVANYPKGKFLTQAWHHGAAALTATGKPADAVRILKQLADDKKTRTDAVLYDLAWASRAAGNAKGAAEAYSAMITEFPQSPRLAAARVERADLMERVEEAADELDKALKEPAIDRRTRAVALYRLGVAQIKLNRSKSAAAMFDAFVTENPQDPLVPSALCEAGAAYARIENFNTANDRLKKVLSDFPKSDAAKLAVIRTGDIQNATGDYEAAGATFDKWLKEHPNNDPLTPLAEFGAGWSLENRALYDAARQHYLKVIGHDKGATAARAQFQIGETHFKEKHYLTAAKELITVDILYAHAPEWAAPALYEAGCAYEAAGDGENAKKQWQECLKRYPNSSVSDMAKKKLGQK